MITLMAHHYVLPDKLDDAKATILENGRAMRSFPGFISRQTLQSESDPLKITTLVTWQRKEQYQVWLDSPERRSRMGGGSAGSLWSRPVESEYFEVVPEL